MQTDFSKSDHTFHLLIKKIIPSINSNIHKNDFFITGLRNILLEPLCENTEFRLASAHQKHKALHRYIRCDICFVPIEKREEIFAIFTTIQKHYMSLLKFYNICKFKLLMKKSCKQYDLFFNDLDECQDNVKIVLYEQTRLYTFKIYDILKIIKSSLINYEELFLVPSLPKNPYTNLAFSYKNLHNIFNHCMFNQITIPKVFRYFYESDFNLNKFIFKYEPMVRESIITNYYNNMSFNQKCDTILSIVNYYRPAIPIVIHDHYPRQKLVTFLDCSIIPYLRSQYSLNPAVKDFNKVKVCTILQTLYKQNRNFGRVYFNVKTGGFTPLDDPFIFVDPSMSPFNFGREYDNTNDNLTNNTNENTNDNIFVFGSHMTNTPNTYDTSDDMDIDSDISDDINTPINIPPQNVSTTDIISNTLIDTLVDTYYSSRPPFTSPVFNPIVRRRQATNIMDLSLNSLSDAEIHNARARLREMLAGDD